jgi:hypothetical protein
LKRGWCRKDSSERWRRHMLRGRRRVSINIKNQKRLLKLSQLRRAMSNWARSAKIKPEYN